MTKVKPVHCKVDAYEAAYVINDGKPLYIGHQDDEGTVWEPITSHVELHHAYLMGHDVCKRVELEQVGEFGVTSVSVREAPWSSAIKYPILGSREVCLPLAVSEVQDVLDGFLREGATDISISVNTETRDVKFYGLKFNKYEE